MRISLAWLGEFIDLPSDAALAERLNLGGFEDAVIEPVGPDLSAVLVGRVARREPHPNADKLSVCSVELGDGAPRQIVCGAPNVAAGQKVAVALPGVRLPDGTLLKKAKIRGVSSQGMICSQRELQLGDEHEGILVLDETAPIGAALPGVLPPGDRVLEVGITPNRGDTASVLGVAREVRAFFGGALRLPETQPAERGAPAADAIRVSIEAPDACHHYAARVVRGVRVGPSPDWLQRRLAASGIRSINNVVDVTNLVLLELGQPLHAFDLAKLEGGELRIRRARAGETIETLDGQKRRLDASDLVIADAARSVALAGVMGGAATEVTIATRVVLLESAHFAPSSVRLSARRHGLQSEASYRFERGVDRDGIVRAADRAAQLLATLAQGEVAAGVVEARGAAAPRTESVELSVTRANRLLGTQLAVAASAELLERLGIACRIREADTLVCAIPSHRNDLHLPQDLVEEIARIHGYEQIPSTLPLARLAPVALPRDFEQSERARDALAALGLLELVTFPFVRPQDLSALGLEETDPRRNGLCLQNPIQEDESRLRTTLLPSLLRMARQNLSRQVGRIGVFEVARCFLPRGNDPAALPHEPLKVAVVVTSDSDRHLWAPAEAPPLFFEAKGIAERLLSALGYVACLRSGGGVSYLHPGATAELWVEGQVVGAVGELHPAVANRFEIAVPCAVLEIDLHAFPEARGRAAQFREVSKEPSVRRDVAVLVDREQASGEILEEIGKVGGSALVSVEIFDRYEGKGIPEGRVSLAFRMVFQRPDRTLTDAEVSKVTTRVIRVLKERFGAELR
ncbi:MAG: phenylalanine--tRNA ligase subunit beta [Myxococcales bacterium]|nr:phenylalanine--tRNA ligase subunit beta [Myxococcales bacterium]MDH5567059.1 phenylalanine--tRNA ligase subunit beta [Myxococcales bacterium]